MKNILIIASLILVSFQVKSQIHHDLKTINYNHGGYVSSESRLGVIEISGYDLKGILWLKNIAVFYLYDGVEVLDKNVVPRDGRYTYEIELIKTNNPLYLVFVDKQGVYYYWELPI